ncbi:MAG: DinB family protein [Balneolaceae bacterium]|nr:DinB family protein [Balneolaceae bacterium]
MKRTALSLLLVLCTAGFALAQSASPSGYAGEVVRELNETEGKLVSLAEAFPENTWDWRPGEGVRSVRETFGHIVDGNFLIPSFMGAPGPEGYQFGQSENAGLGKSEMIQALRDSFTHLREAVTATAGGDMIREVSWFGGSTNTPRGIMLFIPKHLGEHQGQLIAYARMNNITPPWSAE